MPHYTAECEITGIRFNHGWLEEGRDTEILEFDAENDSAALRLMNDKEKDFEENYYQIDSIINKITRIADSRM